MAPSPLAWTLAGAGEFYKVTSKEELIKIFESTKEELGQLNETTLTDWNTVVSTGAINKGSYVLNYSSKFSKGTAIQKISLRKTDDDPIKIIGYTLKVNSL